MLIQLITVRKVGRRPLGDGVYRGPPGPIRESSHARDASHDMSREALDPSHRYYDLVPPQVQPHKHGLRFGGFQSGWA